MASEIAKLAGLVLTHTMKVDDFLQRNKLPTPSFHEDGPIDLGLSPELELARVAAIEASLRLHDLLREPVDLIRPTVNILHSGTRQNMVLIDGPTSTDQCGQP